MTIGDGKSLIDPLKTYTYQKRGGYFDTIFTRLYRETLSSIVTLS